MDFLLELFGEFVFEMIGDALSEGGSVGSLFGQSPWWRS